MGRTDQTGIRMTAFWTALVLSLALASARPQKKSPVWVDDCGKSKYLDAGTEGFIVGGRESRPGENPWQVSLLRPSGSHFCGGIIINEDWVLTAAHCVEYQSASRVRVTVGEHDRSAIDNPSRTILGVSEIIEHEMYDVLADFDADIALLKLSSKITFSEDVQPVCPPERNNDYVDNTCTVSGWGTLSSGGGFLPKVLQQVNLPIPTNADCQRSIGVWYDITDGMICAGNIPENEKDSCQGDSGGPMVVRNSEERFEVVGIVSWGLGCANGTPGVYARVSQYMDWIESKIALYS